MRFTLIQYSRYLIACDFLFIYFGDGRRHNRDMRRIAFFLLLSVFAINSNAAGGITHMYIAQESIPLMHDTKLQNLIRDNMDAYLVGTNYPDSGYVSGTHYGEDSHWPPFINTFIQYLREKYSYPEQQNPRLVAFLLGIAAHNESDIIFHWTFINKVAEKDLKGDWNAAHDAADRGLDLYLLMDKNQWLVRPKFWWVPVQDLVAIYQKMGKNQYTAREITWGNAVYSQAGMGERAIAIPAYPIVKWKYPWMTRHYYDAPEGGIIMNAHKTAEYVECIWQQVIGKIPTQANFQSPMKELHEKPLLINSTLKALQANLGQYILKNQSDGSVEINILH